MSESNSSKYFFADVDYASKETDRRSVSEQLCVQVHMCVRSPERRKALPFQHLRQNMSPLAMQLKSYCPGFEDNQGAVQLSQNPVSNSNSKHIDVRHHFLREVVHQGDMNVVHVPSEYQHAD